MCELSHSLVFDEVRGRGPKSAVIVGVGYIGLEMAEAIRARGLDVTVVEQPPEVLPTVDPEFGQVVHAELERNRVNVTTGVTVTAGGRFRISLTFLRR